jgi:hypothetical protein
MYPHSLVWHILWLAPSALLAVVSAVMLRRGLHRDYPLFFLYGAWQVTFNPALFVFDHVSSITATQYQTLYWIEELGSIALRFAVIYEIFRALFRPHRALQQVVSLLTSAGLVGLMVAAAVLASIGPSAGYAEWLVGAQFVLNRAVSIIQCGMLVILFVLVRYFNLSWRSYMFGIAAGFGIFSTTQLVFSVLQAGWEQSASINFLIMGAYNICVLTWTAYLLVPEPAAAPVTTVPAVDLEAWNQELERLLQR